MHGTRLYNELEMDSRNYISGAEGGCGPLCLCRNDNLAICVSGRNYNLCGTT